jgi:SNF2 family DNA or RNA helicase
LCSIIGLEDVKDNILETVQKYVLRRTKADVGINLPPLILEQWMVPWKNKEEKLMSEELHSLLPNQTGITTMSDGDLAEQFESRGLLIAMLKARQSCILPSLLKKELKHTEYKDVIKTSSKLDAVIELMLIRKDNGNGKIVFCHFSNEINMIAKRLRSVGYKKVAIYDGRNSNTKDGQRVLTEAADVLILQIQTGCEGLNLQENYSEIYFVSPHWNPCVEDQAVARCHRIGQMKPTYVFKFEMCGFENEEDKDAQTLERYVSQVQLRKRTIINQIVSSAYE